ncbi:MAG: hypothetical protein BWY59_00693 [Verrucomicrobia bacterium ADurb.Bin345]|nr:MAG: hypothetical protein BWY59_00693 [Verrucomicrobia bacterium ADurb.Bin345]
MKNAIPPGAMNMHEEERRKVASRRDAFWHIAFWQLMAFLFLLCFVWAVELLDLPAWAFGTEPAPFSLYRVCLLSAGVIAAGVAAIGYTYEQQRALLRKLLETCMYCHRVKTPDETWEHVELYFIKHYPVPMKRGCCPDCEKMLAEVGEESVPASSAVSGRSH